MSGNIKGQRVWSIGRDQALIDMWKTHSASYIANFLNTALKLMDGRSITRNAVMGRLGRLGLLGTSNDNKKKHKPRPPIKPRPPKPVEPIAEAPQIISADMLMLHLMELHNSSCRWIVQRDGFNGSVYCGIDCNPQDTGPYCEIHQPMMRRNVGEPVRNLPARYWINHAH